MPCSDHICREELKVRITTVEVLLNAKILEMEKALTLARETADREKIQRSEELNHRLDKMNEYQKRMDKLEGTFVSKEFFDMQFEPVRKFVYIGVGIMLVVNAVVYLLFRS